jgi:DNA-binding NtrC family response regulator
MSSITSFPTIPIVLVPKENAFEVLDHRPVILVVDDERVIADTLSLILTSHGFAVMTAYDGRSALEIATTVLPDLLISDVVMPDLNGIELALAIMAAVPDCETILFSGQASLADFLAPARAAGYDFTLLSKPIHPSAMLALVDERLKLRAQSPAMA